ncbi:S-adenosyl-L-methionine-dependent methyltransferase [Sphaerosporella brunnea]|uniref:S-adenosyl-L-methionine-dependent methyltransferase n=1 Tax=Sphaerosporella brunnea TaxID=1250544 RepID=A0A5J5ET06_9PEZI|nr:S-adenosyl-L-methionine-dependent methyltransferase [Sphaerosporella brunnea]
MWHEIALRLLGGRLHLSPLDHPQRVLDIGTGTGIWAIDMADKYPMAEVTGIDLNPIQPKWLPQNCKFEIGDVEGDWTFQPDHFDFVHARNLFIGISDWPRLMKEIYRATAPGGYVELTEQGVSPARLTDWLLTDRYQLPTFNDAVMPDDNPINIYSNLMKQAMAKIGRSVVSSDSTLRLRLEQAGFVDIRVAKVKQPIGKWPKDAELKHIGGVGLLQCETGFASYGMAALTRILAMDAEEAERLCRACFSVAMMRESHLFTYIFTAYGRKPEGPADCDPFLYGK